MKLTPSQAEEALEIIDQMTVKTRHSIASSGAHISLIITGLVWLAGFICTQFLSGQALVIIWVGLSLAGSTLASLLGRRRSRQVRSPSTAATTRRILQVWLLLAVYCLAAIAVAWPVDGKQLTVFIVLFVMMGWLVMGLLLSFSPIWPGLAAIGLMLVCYWLLPGYFYLWMAILGGGGMIALGLYIRTRW